MTIDRSFDWLGRFPLAVDIADTVRIVRGKAVELLIDDADLSRWVSAELPRFPSAKSAIGRLTEVRDLRDATRDLLLAHASANPLPRQRIGFLNATSARSPSYTTWEGKPVVVETNDDAFDVFRAQVARSTFEILEQAPDSVAVCRAPGCGMLFAPGNRRQRWCSSQCGNRARVARHAARAGQQRTSYLR